MRAAGILVRRFGGKFTRASVVHAAAILAVVLVAIASEKIHRMCVVCAARGCTREEGGQQWRELVRELQKLLLMGAGGV